MGFPTPPSRHSCRHRADLGAVLAQVARRSDRFLGATLPGIVRSWRIVKGGGKLVYRKVYEPINYSYIIAMSIKHP